MLSPYNLIVILGPTASGKTQLGVELASRYQGEILSADSRQVYRGLDIGSGKDLQEYGAIPYHLIDIVDPGVEYSVFHFQRDFFIAYNEITQRGKLPIMVGGTGLYLDAVLQNYQLHEAPINQPLRDQLAGQPLEQLQAQLLHLKPNQHNQTDLQIRSRVIRAIEIAIAEPQAPNCPPANQHPYIKPLIFGVQWPREELRARITTRLKARLEEGLLKEVQTLLDKGVSPDTLKFYGLEYRLVTQHLLGELNYNDMYQKLNAQIHQFAKRQDTWFRKMQRRGDHIHWLDAHNPLLPQAELIQKDYQFQSALPDQ